MSVIAVVFDFDDTLVPDTASLLLEAHGIDPTEFWGVRVRERVAAGYDPPLAYLNLLLEEVGPGKPLGQLSNRDLRAFGASLDDQWFPGLPEMFDDLRTIVAEHANLTVEFYIISGGLQELIGGSAIVRTHFSGYYGSQLGENASGIVHDVKRCITFTKKTRFVFEINKGIRPADSRTQPHLVNRAVPPDLRRRRTDGHSLLLPHPKERRDGLRGLSTITRIGQASVSGVSPDRPCDQSALTGLSRRCRSRRPHSRCGLHESRTDRPRPGASPLASSRLAVWASAQHVEWISQCDSVPA